MKVSVCVGSACHLKGSYAVIHALQALIAADHLENEVDLNAVFCLNHCTQAVSVKVEDTIYSVSEESVGEFYEQAIKKREE